MLLRCEQYDPPVKLAACGTTVMHTSSAVYCEHAVVHTIIRWYTQKLQRSSAVPMRAVRGVRTTVVRASLFQKETKVWLSDGCSCMDFWKPDTNMDMPCHNTG